MFSFAALVNKPEAETVALAPFETDQVPPEIKWLYWAVVLAQMVAGPVTSKLEIVLPTKLEEELFQNRTNEFSYTLPFSKNEITFALCLISRSWHNLANFRESSAATYCALDIT